VKSRTVIALVAAAAVVVAGAAVAGWWMLRPPTLHDAAEQYLGALESGDIGTLDAMMAGASLSAEERTTIDDAYAGASARITASRIESIRDDGSVRATARLTGKRVTVWFILSREGRAYHLNGDFLGALTVQPRIGDAVRVGRATVAAGAQTLLLPAEYPVTALPADVLTGTARITVTNEKPVTADLDVALAAGATDAVQKPLTAYEDRCAASTTTVPAHCGLRVPWAADLRTLSSLDFRIDRRPALALAPDGTSFAATDGEITATARGEDWDGASRTVVYRADDWALRGRVVFDGATVSLHVD